MGRDYSVWLGISALGAHVGRDYPVWLGILLPLATIKLNTALHRE